MIPGIVAGQAQPPATSTNDPYFANVSALLHLNGTNGAATFPDVKGNTWSRVGTPTISTAQGEYGSSLLLNGANQALETPSAASFNLGSADWTLEATIYLTGYSANFSGSYAGAILSKDTSSAREWYITLSGTASSWTSMEFIGFQSNSTFILVQKPFTFALNTIYKIRVCRSGNTVYMFVNGALIHSAAFASSIVSTGTAVRIGALSYAGVEFYLPAYVWEVRITKGAARSTASYTPASTPFPDS